MLGFNDMLIGTSFFIEIKTSCGKDNFIWEEHSLENKGSLLKELFSSTSFLFERVDRRFLDNRQQLSDK